MNFSRAGRPGAALALLLTLIWLAGCAGHFNSQHDNQAYNYGAENLPLPPLENTDLWGRIRAGLVLTGHDNKNAVRGMVQFFAGQQRHLHESAERAQPYLRHIVDNVEARNMPMEIALLPLVESSFDPFAGGGQRASGLWQFMPVTAKRFGLNHNQWYEGRRDVLLSTRAALDYLGWLNAKFDDWLLALAAYNCGEGCVGRAIESARAQGKATDYWHLDLPRETQRYIPKLLAISKLVAEPERFSIQWPNVADTPAFVAVELPARTSLVTAADMMDTSIEQLRQLNPALRGNITQPQGPHVLLVPAERADQFQAALAEVADKGRLRWMRHEVTPDESLASIARRFEVDASKLAQTNDLTTDTALIVGQKIWIPRLPELPATPKSAPEQPARDYRVVSGDSLWSVARANNVTVKELARWNGLSSTAGLQPGQVLQLRGGASAGSSTQHYRVRNGDSLWAIARRFDTGVDTLRRMNNLSASAVLRPGQRLVVASKGPQTVYYRVRPGDSLWSIATRYQVPVTELKSWNSLGGKGVIRPGQKIKILVDTTG